jgi:hypothetical protein
MLPTAMVAHGRLMILSGPGGMCPPRWWLGAVTEAADPSFAEWLRDRRNSRKVPHKMEECGYRAVRNPNAKAGRWKVSGKDVVIYAKRELCPRDAITAAEKLAKEGENAVPF